MLGFSTGCLFRSSLSIVDIIKQIAVIESDAIELNFGRVDELMGLSKLDVAAINDAIGNFNYVSIHAPFRGIKYDADSIELLFNLKEIVNKLDASHVVFHPDTVIDGSVIERILGEKAAIENMDRNKQIGKSVEDLSILFTQMPSAKFVLDLNHVFTVDRSMKLASDFFDKYKNRIISYHISGYGGQDALHTALPKKDVILKAVPDKAILAIHEGIIARKEEMKVEYMNLKDYFN